jgi:hypothetical protein
VPLDLKPFQTLKSKSQLDTHACKFHIEEMDKRKKTVTEVNEAKQMTMENDEEKTRRKL